MMGPSSEGTTMFVFMVTGEHIENAGQTHRRVIIVGVDDSAEAEAAAKWAVQEAELRTDDLLLVHAYEAPLLPQQTKTVAIAASSSRLTARRPYCRGFPNRRN